MPEIRSVTLADPGAKNAQSVKSNGHAQFNYADGTLHAAPQYGITGQVDLVNPPDSFGLYYRVNADQNAVWQPVITDSQLHLSESFMAQLINASQNQTGNPTTTEQGLHCDVMRTSDIEFTLSEKAASAPIANDDLNPIAKFQFKLTLNGAVEVDIPKTITFDDEILGQSRGGTNRTIALNEVPSVQLKVADTGTPKAPKVVICNPLCSHFDLQLGYLGINQRPNNPFYMQENFKYRLNDSDAKALTNESPDNQWIDGILQRPISEQDLTSYGTTVGWKQSQLQLSLPYNDAYQIGPYNADLKWQLVI